MQDVWEFWIDVGGTFTDCLARSPSGQIVTFKTLSSGITKGRAEAWNGRGRLFDSRRQADPSGFWDGYILRLLTQDARVASETRVVRSDPQTGLELADSIAWQSAEPLRYELSSGEEAPVFAIRAILGLGMRQPLPPVVVRLGTTRGTNALLERKGARTALVITRGFGDALAIGNQDRPRLFELAIRKPEPLYGAVVEIEERLDARGAVLQTPDPAEIRRQLSALRRGRFDSLAICLLHAYRNPAHEELVAQVAREEGFAEISLSSRISPTIKLVSRGDTTVMDAYLTPILREYVQRIQTSLAARREEETTPGPRGSGVGGGIDACESHGASSPETVPARRGARLKLMTSAGGLIDADRFSGHESILSGPAGGVVGFSRVAEQAGFRRAIGFDMGGTSTDVSRYDGRYDLEYESTKAGVRVVTPMLAIETIAAGGGSLCRFDGVKLVVGPESAGADPGPACYGRGGPLTITDANVFLGRVPVDQFPFPLDRSAIADRLETVRREMASSSTLPAIAPEELAAGFIEIANANMARAVRKISVARGYDPSEYVLVSFGGAGGQHACALARLLGMSRVLIHPYAGILSAYGIGLADVRSHRERAVLQPLTTETLAGLEGLFEEMEQAARADVRREEILADRIDRPVRSLDLRYQGIESTINVLQPDDGDYRGRYEALHEQMYGYRRAGRPLEIVVARVEVVGRTSDVTSPPRPVQVRAAQPSSYVRTWFAGEELATAVLMRDQLQPGDRISGPAILCEPTSTVVIDPGWTGDVLARGELLLTDRAEGAASHTGDIAAADTGDETAGHAVDTAARHAGDADRTVADRHTLTGTTPPSPVQLEIFNNLFASIAEQMGVTLQRTAISTNVKERLDFSCAMFDAAGGLVANAPHIPVHLGAMGETVRRILADNPAMQPGDVFVTNDPYRGGSHLPDVTVVSPVHGAGGELLFFTASRAHHAEIGGITPGSMPPFSRSLAEEGVLIRNFRLVEGGRSHEDALRRLLASGPYPSRNVADNLADLAAQVAANRAGARLLCELVDRYGVAVVRAYMGYIQQAAAEKVRRALRGLSDGVRSFRDSLDDGSPIAVTVTIAGDRARVDFTGTGGVLASNLNANRAIATAAVLYVFRCLLAEDIPLNSGVLEPIELVLPQCLLNPPDGPDPAHCAAVVGGNVETSQRVVDVLLGALGLAAASQGTMNNLTFGDATFGYYETICGGSGATRGADGADAVHTHMTNTRLTDVEVLEHRYPVRVLEFSIRRGSGGAGQRRGGDGVVRRLEFLRPVKVSLLTQRRGPYRPFGLAGGASGAPGRNLLTRRGEREAIELGACVELDVQAGDVLTIETPGGGAYGAAGA
jgi:5-oxoprolinase (ATP-hydrolysing)